MSASSAAKPPGLSRLGHALGLSSWVITGLFGLSSLVILTVVTVLPLSTREYLTEQPLGQLLLNASLYLLAVLIVIGIPYWFVVYVLHKPKEKGHTRRILGLGKPFRWRHFGLFALCIIGYLTGTVLLASLATLVPGYRADQAQDVGFSNISGVLSLVLAFIALVILPPIAEELLFRGYLFGNLRERSGFWFSAIVTSIIFGLMHLQWNVGIDTFVLSIFLCILREKTGSIWYSMLLHAFKNGVAYLFLFIGPLIGINIQ